MIADDSAQKRLLAKSKTYDRDKIQRVTLMLRRNLILICALLSFISLAPRPALSQITSLDFGSVTVGQPSSQVLTKTLYLSGIYTSATINTPYITGPDKADFKITQDGFTGGPYSNGAMLSVTITFTPSRTGPEQATLDGSGTVQPGNTPLNFVPVTLTGTGVAPPPPPVTISDVRLGIPTLGTDVAGNRTLTQGVYVTGTGSGTVSGHWLADSQDTQPVSQKNVTLTNGQWFLLGTYQNGNEITGDHSLSFMLDSPAGSATYPEQISISDFTSLSNGWHFVNRKNSFTYLPDDALNSKEFLGICSGMSNLAREYYLRKQSAIQTNEYPTLTRYMNTLLTSEQSTAESWWNKYDYPRIKPYAEGFFFGFNISATPYDIVLSSEANLIQARVKLNDAPVIALRPKGGMGHAVVVKASFFSPNIYNNVRGEEADSMQLFSIYDPNHPDDDNRFLGAFYNDVGNLRDVRFQFIPNDSGYPYILWNLYTFRQ